MQADIGVTMGVGTDIAIESGDIIILSNRLDALPVAREISRRSYRKMVQNVTLAFFFNGIGIPLAATGLIHTVWAMVAMAVSVTAIFFNSLWGSPRLFFDAFRSVGPAGRPGSLAGPHDGVNATVWMLSAPSGDRLPGVTLLARRLVDIHPVYYWGRSARRRAARRTSR